MRDRTEAEKLFSENSNLIYAALSKYLPEEAKDEDIQQIAAIGLWKACLAYDEGAGTKFITFAYRCMRNEIYVELRRRKRREINPPSLSLEQRVSADCCFTWADIIPGDMDVDWADFEGLYAALSERQQFILRERLRGTKTKDCAAALGVSREIYSSEWRRIRALWNKFI